LIGGRAGLYVATSALCCFCSVWQKRKRPSVDSSEPHESKTACIFIHRHKIAYVVDLYGTISDLKQTIGDRVGSDVINNQCIIFSGKQLSDEKRLIDYNIQKHSTLFLSGRLCGGASPGRIIGGMRSPQRRRVRIPRTANTDTTGGTSVGKDSDRVAPNIESSRRRRRGRTTDTAANTTNAGGVSNGAAPNADPSQEDIDMIRSEGLKVCNFNEERQNRVNRIPVMAPILAPILGSFFKGHISLKNRTYCPLLDRIQPLSKTRVFLYT
jgi:hypothetical protein